LATRDPGTAVARIREQIDRCEKDGADVLCCPEAVLGGLGDFSANPAAHALHVENGELAAVLAPLRSPTVTAIVGFSERTPSRALFNSAAIVQRGTIIGLYRKNRPALRHSIYQAGTELPVFRAGELVFGVLICNDSNFPELARTLVAKGARVIFSPSNNGLPHRDPRFCHCPEPSPRAMRGSSS
jgi:predicted amidohydrolase